MPVGRQDRGGIADRDPADRHRRILRHDRLEVDGAVDPHLGAGADHRVVEHRRPGRQEDVIGDRAAGEIGARPDEDVIADAHRRALARLDDGVLHDDAALAEHDAPVLGREHRAEGDGAAGPDPHAAAQDGGRRDRRRGIDDRPLAAMLVQHQRAANARSWRFATVSMARSIAGAARISASSASSAAISSE